MSADSVVVILGSILSAQPICDFRFALQFAASVPKGTPESGEFLDAQSFDIANSRVMIGTEDGDALASRLCWFELTESNYPIGYLRNGFELSFAYIPPRATLDFHFVIAYNATASDDCSEWFAVDVPHKNILLLDSIAIPSNSS